MKRLDHFPFQASANNQTLLIDKNFSFEDSYRVSPDIPQWVSTVKMPITREECLLNSSQVFLTCFIFLVIVGALAVVCNSIVLLLFIRHKSVSKELKQRLRKGSLIKKKSMKFFTVGGGGSKIKNFWVFKV